MARRDGNRVRLFTRRGYDWSAKYPWIVESLLSLRVRSITVDGEAVWAGTDGKSDFDKLHSGGHDGEESWSRKSEQSDKWSFCLTAGTLCPANQERP
jgi:ATP-dependent DNA ligase